MGTHPISHQVKMSISLDTEEQVRERKTAAQSADFGLKEDAYRLVGTSTSIAEVEYVTTSTIHHSQAT